MIPNHFLSSIHGTISLSSVIRKFTEGEGILQRPSANPTVNMTCNMQHVVKSCEKAFVHCCDNKGSLSFSNEVCRQDCLQTRPMLATNVVVISNEARVENPFYLFFNFKSNKYGCKLFSISIHR